MTQKAVPASATGGAGYTVAYGYDNRGLQLSATFSSGGGISNGYDNAGRLQAAVTTLAGVPRTISYAYDANGNLTSDGVTLYTYDAENRLVRANEKTSGALLATLTYDPNGRLWQVTGPNGTTRLEYDGDKLTEEFNAAGTQLRVYAHGPGTDEPLVWWEVSPSWQRHFLHADHQGSITAIADDTGAALAINAYDAWGVPNPANQGRFGYTGQTWLPELGMWYYKARIYSPMLGRFLQTDPIGYRGGVNLYNYVDSDPVNRTDPTGNNPVAVVIVVEGAEACAANPLCRGVAIWAAKQVVRVVVQHYFPPMPGPMPVRCLRSPTALRTARRKGQNHHQKEPSQKQGALARGRIAAQIPCATPDMGVRAGRRSVPTAPAKGSGGIIFQVGLDHCRRRPRSPNLTRRNDCD